jgi:hypothetical protein
MSNFLELISTSTSLVAERNKHEGVKEMKVPHSSDGEAGGMPERDGKLCSYFLVGSNFFESLDE